MINGAKPKADGAKVTRHPLTHEWMDVADVPFEPPEELRDLPGRWGVNTLRWWRIVSTMPHCVLWTPAEWEFARETATVNALFWRTKGEKGATELRDRERRLGMTMEGRRDLRIRYVKPPEVREAGEGEQDSRVTDFDTERRRRLSAE